MAEQTVSTNTTNQTENNFSRNVWCTLVMLGDSYAPGAAVVAQTLRNVGTKYPVWCMVTEDVSSGCVDFLKTQFDNVVTVPLISRKVVPMKSKKQNEIYGSWIHASFTKWNIFDPKVFPVDKVILIDADMMFLENCDELFDLTPPALTFSSPWARPYVKPHPKNKNYILANPYGEMPHGQIVPKENILKGFRGGILGLACMVLVKPSAHALKTLHAMLSREEVYGTSDCVSGFDEQLLAEVLLALGEPIRHIHQRYNWVVGKYNWLLNKEKPKTQQYYNGKPWLEDRDKTEWEDVKSWYRIWDQVVKKDDANAKWLRK